MYPAIQDNEDGLQLNWCRTEGTQYELRQDDRVLASLEWSRWQKSFAEAITPRNHLTFQRALFFSRRVTISKFKSGKEVGVFVPRISGPHWRKGTLNLTNNKYRWSTVDFWRRDQGWYSADNELLIKFQPYYHLFSLEADVTVMPGVEKLPETLFLTTLGFYLLQLRRYDK